MPHSKLNTHNSKLNLRSALILVICITALSVIYQKPLVQIALLAITFCLLLVMQPSPKAKKQLIMRLSRIGRIILVIFFFQLLFRRNGNPLFEFSFIKITDTGLNYALASSLRFFIIILIAGLLMDYPFQDFLIALNAWKFPYEIAFIVAATIHFLPVFKATFDTKMEALALRGIALKKLSLKKRLAVFRLLILPVIATAINDVKYRAISLELRAFRLYPNRTFLHSQALKPIDYLIISIAGIATIAAIILLKL